MDKVIQLLRFLSASLNVQLKLRVNEHLRAAMWGGSIALIALGVYLGKISKADAGELLALSGAIFGLAVAKTAPGETPGLSLSQAPTLPKPEPGTTTPLTTVVGIPDPKQPLGPEFKKD